MEDVFDAANTDMVPDHLLIRGEDVGALATSFVRMLGDAATSGDFTMILAPERDFYVSVACLQSANKKLNSWCNFSDTAQSHPVQVLSGR